MTSSHPPFEHISSTANDTVKLLRSLDRKKERQATGLFLAEGAHFAEEALSNGWKNAIHPEDVNRLVELWKIAVEPPTLSEMIPAMVLMPPRF